MSNGKTLDVYHKQKLEEIHFVRERVKHLDERLREVRSIEPDRTNVASYVKRIDEELEIKEELARLNRELSEHDYYIRLSPTLYKYYDLVENGRGHNMTSEHPKHSIMRYFSQEAATKPEPAANNPEVEQDTRGNLLDTYMSIVDSNYIKSVSMEETCTHCDSKDMVKLVTEGYSYCQACDTMMPIIIDHDKPSYRDPPNEVTYFSYKRINHLNEWLNQVQGKETTEIPEEIYDKILLEIKKQRITNMAELTYDKVKKILKHLKVHKYYEHIPHIINRLNGFPMPNFTSDLEDKLRNMFKQIQMPFLKHSPPNRKNFLSYSFVLHKFLQLLEKDEYLTYFPLLKSRDKLVAQDKIWKLICQDCGWQFIPSL